jgi:hypothetical protein
MAFSNKYHSSAYAKSLKIMLKMVKISTGLTLQPFFQSKSRPSKIQESTYLVGL